MKHKPEPTRNPINIDDDNWYYEYIGRLDFVHRCRTQQGEIIKTDIVKIPMRKIRETIKRIYGVKLTSPSS